MKTLEDTLYVQYPFLLFTPFAWWDIGLASMWNAYIDGCFVALQHTSAPVKPVGDMLPPAQR